MVVTRINETFFVETGNRISAISYLNLFNILQDSDGTKYLNIWKSFVLNEDVQNDTIFYTPHHVDSEDWWDGIAYEYYGSPGLWWAIALMNNVVNPFEELESGTNIKILRDRYIYQLTKEMKDIRDL